MLVVVWLLLVPSSLAEVGVAHKGTGCQCHYCRYGNRPGLLW